MELHWRDIPELQKLGSNLLVTRQELGFNQGQLARACGLSQAQVSLFETGRRIPSLDQFIRLARALNVPLQKLLTGTDRPGHSLKDIAVELNRLGAVDLWIADATVPGSARSPEEVIALALSGSSPDPRIVDTIPALLSWNEINPIVLRAYGITTRTIYRIAWLSEAALSIDRQKGFPGGCNRKPLERFIQIVGLPSQAAATDDLGRPKEGPPKSPLWRRWKISYDVSLDDLARRANELASLRRREDQAVALGTGRGRPRLAHPWRVRVYGSSQIQSKRLQGVNKLSRVRILKSRKAKVPPKGQGDGG